jgi:hypothetical protein
MKGKQTYIERLGFYWAWYFLVNGSCFERTPHWRGGITLDEPALIVGFFFF